MKLCRVLGSVVATAKHPAFERWKMLVVQPVDERGGDTGHSFLAVDDAQAGTGDIVLVLEEGNGIRQLVRQGAQVPIRALIVGIVDQVEARVP